MPKRRRFAAKEDQDEDQTESQSTSQRNQPHDDDPPITKPKISTSTSTEDIIASTSSSSIASTSVSSPMTRLGIAFYDQPCIDLAKSLLGKVLVRKIVDSSATPSPISVLLTARIVETESYLGGEDRASHSFNNRRTDRNEAMYMRPGTAYVYLTYGMYDCFNISSRGDGAAVLIRAVEPLFGVDHMRQFRRRSQRSKKSSKTDVLDTIDSSGPPPIDKALKVKDICGGPSKLCMAMAITRRLDRVDLNTSEEFYVADDGYERVKEERIVECPRIGINNAGEWNTKPLRFYIGDSDYVSVKAKIGGK